MDESDENNAEDDEVNDSGASDNNKRSGVGDYDYDIDAVLGIGDDDNYDDNYEE